MKTFVVKLKNQSGMPEIKIKAQEASGSSTGVSFLGSDNQPIAEFQSDALAGWWLDDAQVKL